MADRIADGVVRLGLGVAQAYLVALDDGPHLVDTGTPGNADRILAAADGPGRLHDRIDTDRIAMAGHSVGGFTAAELAFSATCGDDRIDAVVIMSAIVISGFVSLSLTPLMCSRFLTPPGHSRNILFRATEKVFDFWRDVYGWTLRGVMRARPVMLLVAIGSVYATYYVYKLTPTGFIPATDTGNIVGNVEFPQDGSYDSMVATASTG